MKRDLKHGRRAEGSQQKGLAQALKTHLSGIATGLLLLCIFLLLVGLALQLPPPTPSAPP